MGLVEVLSCSTVLGLGFGASGLAFGASGFRA